MKVITKYIAEDGKEFSTEPECRQYEWRINHFPLSFEVFDADMNHLDGANTTDEVEEAYLKAKYLRIHDTSKWMIARPSFTWKEDIEFFEYYWGLDTDGVVEPGFYEYDEHYAEWRKIEEKNI